MPALEEKVSLCSAAGDRGIVTQMRDARRGAKRQEQQDKTGGKVQRIKSARASEYSLAGDSVVVVAKLVAIRHSFGSHLDDGGLWRWVRAGSRCSVAIAKIDQTK